MRHRTPHLANPVRLPRPKPGNGASPRISSAVVTALFGWRLEPDPTAAASAVAARVLAAPSFRFPLASEGEVQADALAAFYRRAIDAHDDPDGHDTRDLARREEAVRHRLELAWGDLQRAAERFLAEAKR